MYREYMDSWKPKGTLTNHAPEKIAGLNKAPSNQGMMVVTVIMAQQKKPPFPKNLQVGSCQQLCFGSRLRMMLHPADVSGVKLWREIGGHT